MHPQWHPRYTNKTKWRCLRVSFKTRRWGGLCSARWVQLPRVVCLIFFYYYYYYYGWSRDQASLRHEPVTEWRRRALKGLRALHIFFFGEEFLSGSQHGAASLLKGAGVTSCCCKKSKCNRKIKNTDTHTHTNLTLQKQPIKNVDVVFCYVFFSSKVYNTCIKKKGCTIITDTVRNVEFL